MRHVGIVACSAEGAALCYRSICHGKLDHPRVTLDSIPLARWMPAFDAGDYRTIAAIMLESVRTLAAAGADFAICPDNSAHPALEFVEPASPIPWLHIGRVVAAEASARGYRRVGVIGTRFTMRGRVYPDGMAAVGIETVAPDGADFETIDRTIFDELIAGVFTDAAREAFLAVIARLGDRGCDAVALACTEIPLLVTPDTVTSIPTLDSTRLLAAAALREARR